MPVPVSDPGEIRHIIFPLFEQKNSTFRIHLTFFQKILKKIVFTSMFFAKKALTKQIFGVSYQSGTCTTVSSGVFPFRKLHKAIIFI